MQSAFDHNEDNNNPGDDFGFQDDQYNDILVENDCNSNSEPVYFVS